MSLVSIRVSTNPMLVKMKIRSWSYLKLAQNSIRFKAKKGAIYEDRMISWEKENKEGEKRKNLRAEKWANVSESTSG